MNQIVFTLRMSPETAKRLSSMAALTERSKAGMMRWLIDNAPQFLAISPGDLRMDSFELAIGQLQKLYQQEE